MEKLGVVMDDEQVKTAGSTKTCPKCGGPLSASSEVSPPIPSCANCGTEPFEKKPVLQSR